MRPAGRVLSVAYWVVNSVTNAVCEAASAMPPVPNPWYLRFSTSTVFWNASTLESCTYDATVPSEMSKSPAAILKSSPAVTAFDASNASDPKNVPADDADQNDTWLYVSVVDTLVHDTSALLVIAPPDAAENVAS